MERPDKISEFKALLTAAAAAVTALVGWVGWLILIMLVCMVLDYLTGTWAALYRGEWSSKAARQGLWHKLGEISALLVAVLCDLALAQVTDSGVVPLPFEYSTLATPVVSVWYIFTELGSISENAAKLGAPVPTWLGKMLSAVRSASDEDNKGNEK